jgi:hypothetical protein
VLAFDLRGVCRDRISDFNWSVVKTRGVSNENRKYNKGEIHDKYSSRTMPGLLSGEYDPRRWIYAMSDENVTANNIEAGEVVEALPGGVPSPSPMAAKPRWWQIGWDRWIELAFTLAIVGATVVNVLVASWQWSAMLEANRTNNASFVSTQRAYMYFAGHNDGSYKDGSGANIFTVAPTIGNSGNTPTEGLVSKVACWFDEQVETEPFDHFQSLQIDWTDGFYGPHTTLQATTCDFTIDQLRALLSKRLHAYAAGEIRYFDSVDARHPQHVTQFAIEFLVHQFDEGATRVVGAVATRGHHNCADRGCPS